MRVHSAGVLSFAMCEAAHIESLMIPDSSFCVAALAYAPVQHCNFPLSLLSAASSKPTKACGIALIEECMPVVGDIRLLLSHYRGSDVRIRNRPY